MADSQLSILETVKQFRAPLVSNILILIIQISLTVVAINILQPVVPLFNNQLLASNTLMPKIWLALLPGLSLFFSLCSLMLMLFSRSLGKTILTLFAWATTALNGILLVSLIRIVLLVK
ncbi:MAG: hypothetical protein O2840_02640 [bacterium]|nr:hypothetical protein [bacterium]